jgi:hypothetical protein
MTKQIPDKVLYKGREFILAGLKGTGICTPIDFGISREMMGIATACYRGYVCHYACIDNRLFLIWLGILQEEDVELPFIAGISATPYSILFSSHENLKIQCPLSGGLLLVRNPVGLEDDVPSPWDFKEVIEVLFEDGMLQQEIDHSKTVAALRKSVDDWSFVSDYERQPPW